MKVNKLRVNAHLGVVKILKAEGVEWVSVFPSSSFNNPCGDEDIQNIMMRNERFAIAVADGFTRVSNGKKFGVCTVQGGLNACGVQYGYGALAQAYEDNTPLLCLTDGIPPQISGVKRYEVTEALKSITKWIAYVNKPNRVPEIMNRAYSYLRTGRTGPILVQVPPRLGEYDNSDYPYISPKGWKQLGDPRDIKKAVRALLVSKNPIIYAGQGIFYGDACEELLEFAELMQAPVLTTLKGKSCFPENHYLSLGVKGEPASRFLQSSDLVFALGCSLNPGNRYGGFTHQIPGTKRSDLIPAQASKVIVQCTHDPMDINRYYQVDHAILGDIKLVLDQLIAEVKEQVGSVKTREEMLEELRDAKNEHMEKFMSLMTSDEKPINPYRVYGELMNTIDRENSVVTHDSGYPREALATVYEAIIPHGFLGWGNVSTLGFGLGAAVGTKLAFPKRQVVNVAGDAAVGYQLTDYEAQARNKIGITTIHINNDGFSGYGPGFWGKGHDPYVSAVTPSSISHMANAVEAMGLYAERVEDPDEIPNALKRAFRQNESGRPAYLEIICCQYPVAAPWLNQ